MIQQIEARLRATAQAQIDSGSLTNKLLAARCQCSAAHASSWRSGRKRFSPAKLDLALRACGILDLDELVDGRRTYAMRVCDHSDLAAAIRATAAIHRRGKWRIKLTD